MAISEVYAVNGDTSVDRPAGVSEVFVTNMPEGGGDAVTDVKVDGASVVSDGVASITMPTALVPTVTSSDVNKVLTAVSRFGVGNTYEWQNPTVVHYEGISTGTITGTQITMDSMIIESSADVTSIEVPDSDPAINSLVVQWTVQSVTTLPTVSGGTGNPRTYKASSNNPASLTIGKTYQLSILNDCWTIVEFG